MKRCIAVCGAVVVAAFAVTLNLFAEGSLEPPGDAVDEFGAPVPYMKTLDQIEPRTLISSIPYTISKGGSYYLVRNLTFTNPVASHGIVVEADDVLLDLRGFSLSASTNVSSGDGIHVSTRETDPWQYFNITIQNGVIRGWGSNGVDTADADDCQIVDMKVIGNGQYGMLVGPNSLVQRCSVRDNGSCGIEIHSGGTVADCKIHMNGKIGPYDEGIYANQGSKITGCTANNNTVGIWGNSYCTVRDCTVLWNDTHGIRVGSSCRIEDNNCGYNAYGGVSGAGIYVQGSGNRIEGNNVTDNDIGIWVDSGGGGNLIVRNSAEGNTTVGFMTSGNDYYGVVEDSGSMQTNGFTAGSWSNFEF